MRVDGYVARGGQDLPGNWQSKRFHRPLRLPHNDAVVQGLSEAPLMRDVGRWGVLTIGTGPGSARFTNKPPGL